MGAAEQATGIEPARKIRRAGKRRITFTREGRVFVLVTLGVGIAALNTGNNLMYLSMAFMLSLIVLSGILSELAIKGLRVTRTLPERAFAGEPMLVELSVENDKQRLPSYSIELEDRAECEGEARPCYLLKIEPSATRKVICRRRPERRGALEFESVRIGTRYPFSLFHKWRAQPLPQTCLVYPRLAPWDVEAVARSLEGEQGGAATGQGAETRELRDYRDRDEVRRIHWRRTAAVGRPVVRELEDEASPLISLVLDNARPEGDVAFEARLESAISRAAYAAQKLSERGASVELVARGERSVLLAPGTPVDPVWRFLATLRVHDAADAPAMAASRPRAQRVKVEGAGDEG